MWKLGGSENQETYEEILVFLISGKKNHVFHVKNQSNGTFHVESIEKNIVMMGKHNSKYPKKDGIFLLFGTNLL